MTAHYSLRIHAGSRGVLRASCHLFALAAMGLSVCACARSGLEPGDLEPGTGGVASIGGAPSSTQPTTGGTLATGGIAASGGIPATGGLATTGGVPTTGGAPVIKPPVASGGAFASGGSSTNPSCVPSSEVCNGRDDDCNGRVDETAPVPCPGGSFSYCVAGRQSECPKRCEACVPGSERVCFVSFCTFWGRQTCTADGRSFGACREERVPDVCKGVGSARNIGAIEKCCLDHGFCCVDSEDLDQDGNRSEMLGACQDVSCQ